MEVFLHLFPSFFWSPSHGPAVHVPPPTCADSQSQIQPIYYGGLAHTKPSCATIKQSYKQIHCEYAEYTKYLQYDLISSDLCTPPKQKHKHSCVFSSRCWSFVLIEKRRSTLQRTRFIHSVLRSTVRDSWLPDEHCVRAIGYL